MLITFHKSVDHVDFVKIHPTLQPSWYQSTIQHNLKIILVKIISTQPFLPIFFFFSIYSFGLKLLKKGKLDTEILPQKLKFLFTSWVTLLHNSLINLKSLTIERNITCGIVQFLYQHIYVLVLVQCNVVILMSATGREGR